MKTWVVVVFSYFSCEFEVFEFMRAENPATAVKKVYSARRDQGKIEQEHLDWVVGMSADLQQMKGEFAEGELAVEVKEVPQNNVSVPPNIPPFTMTGQSRQNFTVHADGKGRI